MSPNGMKTWLPILIAVLAGSMATALVPQTVPILGAIAKTFHARSADLGWIVSFPTVVCALGSLAFGIVVDRVGDVRLLLAGMALLVLGDAGVSLALQLQWLFAARLFQGFGYLCVTVAAPTFIHRVTAGDLRRSAMALWAAHTPVGFAGAVFFGAQLVAAGLSWRWSFLGHAVMAVLVGLAALTLTHAPTAAKISRSRGMWLVLSTPAVYAVAMGALSAAMLQVGVMTLLPSLLVESRGLSVSYSALVIVAAMLAVLGGAMLIVATRVRKIPTIALPLAAGLAALMGFITVSGLATNLAAELAYVMAFAAAIGAANSLIWSMLAAAAPSPDTAGATAGLVTQGSFAGVVIGPPTFFWIRHESPVLTAVLALLLAILMVVALVAHRPAGQSGLGKAQRAVNLG